MANSHFKIRGNLGWNKNTFFAIYLKGFFGSDMHLLLLFDLGEIKIWPNSEISKLRLVAFFRVKVAASLAWPSYETWCLLHSHTFSLLVHLIIRGREHQHIALIYDQLLSYLEQKLALQHEI